MSTLPARIVLVLAATLIAGCAGDDTVNPLPPPEAGADASKDAAARDGAGPHDGAAEAKAAEAADAGPKDAALDSP
jgi:hypothetical protein